MQSIDNLLENFSLDFFLRLFVDASALIFEEVQENLTRRKRQHHENAHQKTCCLCVQRINIHMKLLKFYLLQLQDIHFRAIGFVTLYRLSYEYNLPGGLKQLSHEKQA